CPDLRCLIIFSYTLISLVSSGFNHRAVDRCVSVTKVSSDISSNFCQLFVTSKIKRSHDLNVFYTVSFGSTQPMEQNIDKELFLYHPFALDQWWKHPFYTNPIDMVARSTISLV